jgi:hypothetical protein
MAKKWRGFMKIKSFSELKKNSMSRCVNVEWQKIVLCGGVALFMALSPSSALAKSKLKSCADQQSGDYGKKECKISIMDVHLTQYAVGKVAVECKIKKVDKWIEKHRSSNDDSSMVKALNAYLKSDNRHIPLVRGPKGADGKTFYTTDHHHLGTAVWNYDGFLNLSKKNKKKVKFIAEIKADYSGKTWKQFWQAMIAGKQTWPYDNQGNELAMSDFNSEYGPYPANFGVMFAEAHNDKYRSLSRWVRENCLYIKDGKDQCDLIAERSNITPQAADFMEFVWANYLRKRLPWPTAVAQSHDNTLLALYSKSPVLMRSDDAKNWLLENNYDPAAFGYHNNGQYLYLNFDQDSCEDPTEQIVVP